jgi:hypothetical protein
MRSSTTVPTPTLDPSRLSLEREILIQQVQQLSSQLASMNDGAGPEVVGSSTTPRSAQQGPQLSEAFFLERERERAIELQAERQSERERAERSAERTAREAAAARESAERERAERMEARLVAAFSVSVCTCGLGAAIVGAAMLHKRD